MTPTQCYFKKDGYIHNSSIIGEDNDYYYTVPSSTIKKIPKQEVQLSLRVIWNNIYLRRY